jgi:2-hydroxy-4-carboxymuconate semialdehyde hemiacetal dehydrogenase
VTGLALIGYGAIAEIHATALRALGGSIRVVVGPNRDEAEAFAERHGIDRVETDPARAIGATDVAAIVVASPSPVHAEQARAALEAGRDVLVEIPLALSAAEGESLVALADGRGLTLMVCHTLRYWEPIRAVEAMIAEGRLHPRSVVARALSLRRENVGWTGRRRTWTDDLLWHHGGHVIDTALRLLGTPVEDVTAAIGPVWEGSGLPMDYAITIRTAGGGIASISLSYNAAIGASDYVVIGEDETVAIDGANVRTTEGPVYEADAAAAVLERAVLEQDRDFLESIETGRRPGAAAADILAVLRVQQAVQDMVA